MTKTICVCHDIEGGLGHIDVDPGFARRADDASEASVDTMLSIERASGVRATYNVVGSLVPHFRERIREGGHALAFHSFDHRLEPKSRWRRRAGAGESQLERCRRVDRSIVGYRPAQSLLTPELTDRNLRRNGFDWLASGSASLGIESPRSRGGVARIPILFDDFPLHTGKLDYRSWEALALSRVDRHDFVAFGLHDCYGEHWVSHYAGLLEQLTERGTLRTLDQVSSGLRTSA